MVAYPVWDAVANLVDAHRNGGLRANLSQAFNTAVSTVTMIAVVIALGHSLYAVVAVFGAWAILSGVLQLTAGMRRWRAGAQWVMVLSGAQSALAGTHFIAKATGNTLPSITDIAPYPAFGAFYFLVSAAWLTVAQSRRAKEYRSA